MELLRTPSTPVLCSKSNKEIKGSKVMPPFSEEGDFQLQLTWREVLTL